MFALVDKWSLLRTTMFWWVGFRHVLDSTAPRLERDASGR